MTYRIYIELRIDKQKLIIEAVKELADDFVILQGRSSYNKTHVRPCQVIEVLHEGLWSDGVFKSCIDKLKKILGVSHILVTEVRTEQVLY